VQVYDNAPWYVTARNITELEFNVDGGSFTAVPMRFSGGQIFRGELPGSLAGTIGYRARSTDLYGNTGTSPTLFFDASLPCTGGATAYCTAKVNSQGCRPRSARPARPARRRAPAS
jgi:hypothetical protein